MFFLTHNKRKNASVHRILEAVTYKLLSLKSKGYFCWCKMKLICQSQRLIILSLKSKGYFTSFNVMNDYVVSFGPQDSRRLVWYEVQRILHLETNNINWVYEKRFYGECVRVITINNPKNPETFLVNCQIRSKRHNP